MKEFKISDDLLLRRSCKHSVLFWYLLRFKKDQLGAMAVQDFLVLSDEEAETVVAKIQKTMQDEREDPETDPRYLDLDH